jgi:hypothetical protein
VRSPLWIKWTSPTIQRRLYRAAMERGYLDAILNECFVKPFLRIFNGCDRIERAWTRMIEGNTPKSIASRMSLDAVVPKPKVSAQQSVTTSTMEKDC